MQSKIAQVSSLKEGRKKGTKLNDVDDAEDVSGYNDTVI